MLKACGLKLMLVAGNVFLELFIDTLNMTVKVLLTMLVLFYTIEVIRGCHILFVEILT